MIGELMNTTGALGLLGLVIVVYGVAPGLALSLIIRLLHKDDPRRRELHAELYAVPRWERPIWVGEQLEVALREGLFPMTVWYWDRLVWHRATIESGADRNREYPDSFWVPSQEEKDSLLPGDSVKLMWGVKRDPGERMWVKITERDGDRLVGTLDSWPVFVRMNPSERVKFHIDDIIDFVYEGEEDDVA